MDQEIDKKLDFKEKLILFYKENKLKIIISFLILIVILISLFFFNIYQEKKNNIVSQKYIKAGIYLTKNKKNDATKLFEEILESGNRFYSVLSLNSIIENNLIIDESKILKNFEKIEKKIKSEEQLDLIKIKKALYLISNSKVEEGNKILKNIIDSDSKLKLLAEEIISK